MGYHPLEWELEEAMMKERKRCLQLIERRRQQILANPYDPSWTEHFAELQNEILWNEEAPDVIVPDPERPANLGESI